MGATPTEIASLRRQLATDATALPDADINAMWAEAEALYPAHVENRRLLFAAVRLQAWREMMVQASKRVDYKQNQSEEKGSQLLANMRVLEAKFEKELTTLLTQVTRPPVQWGGIRNHPPRKRDVPNG
jgi:hypothetical protein